MSKSFKILTIVGSPHDKTSNTRAFVNDFLDDIEKNGPALERQFISLGKSKVTPCIGCWNCTINKPCPLKGDDLANIKEAMLDCDMLVLASPVYTNQVTAQMKALFDRLFTWCHILPLLGKIGLTACTTGNDGHKETGDFLEKMLATYGVSSFGTIVGTGAYTPGFFPRRSIERAKYTELAAKVSLAIQSDASPRITKWNQKMFKVMKRKLMGIHTVNFMKQGPTEGQPDPPKLMIKFIKGAMKKKGVSNEQLFKLGSLMTFELSWWQYRGWLKAKSFSQLRQIPVPETFNIKGHLL